MEILGTTLVTTMWAACVAVVLCAATSTATTDLPWWRTATNYEIYPRSFKDSDGDGTGDFKGIIEKLDYLKELGVSAIWMAPINPSPMVDGGYDVSDYMQVDPAFGTMADFDGLLDRCRQLGIKLMLDFVPNHTSDQHPWFQASVNTSHPLHQYYRDFYVWQDSKGQTPDGRPIPPNNWLSNFGGSAWEWSDSRQQFYLHQFVAQQPDLNYLNTDVVDNMTNVLSFWIEKGVDGFRVDAPAHLYEDPQLRDEQPYPWVDTAKGYGWFQVNHTRTLHQPATLQLLDDWADFLYQRGFVKGRQLAMVLEVYASVQECMKYYGTGKRSLKYPFNFQLQLSGGLFMWPSDIKNTVDKWMAAMPADGVPNWSISNHDLRRIATHFGSEMVDTMSMLTGVLPGVQFVYYGDEIGMVETPVTWDQARDPWVINHGPYGFGGYSRDSHRTPMQWDNSVNAGFSANVTTWLPVNPNYYWLNVEAQRAAPVSHLKVFQAVARARQDPVLQRGDLKVIVPKSNTLFITRSYNKSLCILVANLGTVPTSYTSRSLFSPLGLDADLTVAVSSVQTATLSGTNFKKGSISFTLPPKASLLLRSRSCHPVHSIALVLVSTVLLAVTSSRH